MTIRQLLPYNQQGTFSLIRRFDVEKIFIDSKQQESLEGVKKLSFFFPSQQDTNENFQEQSERAKALLEIV